MAGLFGTTATGTSSNATNGDISKDIALTAPPEDSVSDISFSPQSEHLAVASWDKKVRIYEINAQGGSEGKALYEHEQPVLSCCWSKVSLRLSEFRKSAGLSNTRRMAPKLSVAEQIKQHECSISTPAKT